jgi:hypothetical protein
MILNLGSKETAFIYILIIGSFLTLYWLVRLAQRLWQWPGRRIFYFLMAAILLAGVAALGIYAAWAVVAPPVHTSSRSIACHSPRLEVTENFPLKMTIANSFSPLLNDQELPALKRRA